jgi:SAM-dependent methyltransferase
MDLQSRDPAACARAELLDLGSGSGRRLLDEALRFGVKSPLGVDRNRAKVTRAQASGVPVYEADFMDLDPAAFPNVKVVVFDNVLEHLPSPNQCKRVRNAYGLYDLAAHGRSIIPSIPTAKSHDHL